MEGCERDHLARGYCRKHYEAARRTGDPLGGIRATPGPCSEEDCQEKSVGRGLCRKHYGRVYMREYREARRVVVPPKPCKFCGNPIPTGRRVTAVFCNKTCKGAYELGFASAEYERMLETQGGLCAICRRPEPNGNHQRWCIDHDHKTGRKRGLLCINCNSLLGFAKDNAEILAAAITYLEG